LRASHGLPFGSAGFGEGPLPGSALMFAIGALRTSEDRDPFNALPNSLEARAALSWAEGAERPMAIVVDHEPRRDANCLVVWCDTTGRPAYGSYYSFLRRHAAACPAADDDWDTTIDVAVTLAERNGIPTVYLVKG